MGNIEPMSDRLPPHSEADENAVMAAILLDYKVALPMVRAELPQGQDSFYVVQNQNLYRFVMEMDAAGKAIDPATVAGWLKPEQMESVGGIARLAGLPDHIGSILNLQTHLEAVRAKHRLRSMIRVCLDATAKAYEANGAGDDVLAEFEADVMAIRNSTEGAGGFSDVCEIARALVDDYQAACDGDLPMGVETGFIDLDRTEGGMFPQEMIVLAGLRSSGKTSLAFNIAVNCVRRGDKAGIISLETSAKKAVHRMLSSIGQYDGSELLRGRVMQGTEEKCVMATTTLRSVGANILLKDTCGMSEPKMLSIAGEMARAGAKLIVVDYLQLLETPGRTEYERVTQASKSIKKVAKMFNVPVIVVASLNRESDRDNRPPKLSDLRASGQIEYDADKVWLLHPEDYSPVRTVRLEVAKNKEGAIGPVTLTFFASQFRFESCARVAHEERETKGPHNDP